MNKFDIVYFDEPHFALYTSGEHHFHKGPYVIWNITGYNDTCIIRDLKNNETHFICGDGYKKLITEKRYKRIVREQKLKRILK